MKRSPNTTRTGTLFTQDLVFRIWQKATYVSGTGINEIRKDRCGAMMRRSDYGKTTLFGWEIDHNIPVSAGGNDSYENLQPLHWKNNRYKGDSWPFWTCLIKN